jgi:PBSX family phage terminase large subunit
MKIKKIDLPLYDFSVPHVLEFDPRYIKWQCSVINEVDNFDYSKGPLEILLTGAAGSSKSLLGCHLIARHMSKPGNVVCIGRRSRVDLRETLWDLFLKHIRCYDEGTHYWINDTRMGVGYANGSKLISRSWGDRKAKGGRSLDLTMLVIEEATENDEKDMEAINELVARVGRRPAPEMIVLFMTNPDSPSHPLYKRFFTNPTPNRRVFHSVTTDNPFLPKSYITNLESTFDPKMILRMRDGIWLDVVGETIYHQYASELHEVNEEYKVSTMHPIHITWDFNIGAGKPLSCVVYQIVDGKFHFFDEVVIEGARTESNLEELANKGLLDYPTTYLIHGDQTGMSRDTRSQSSDYQIIDQFLKRHVQKSGDRIRYRIEVPSSNPSIRVRHNLVNSYLKNASGEIRTKVYPKCVVLREGFKLTKLKKGAQYQEDDSKYYQHITTAAGYGYYWHDLMTNRKRSSTREL